MGVRGLTTYINYNEMFYLDNYTIPPNSILLLDGESVAANIYVQHLEVRNTIFGGDYEIYADAIIKFFNMLFDCKIVPYVVCSGATEARKVDTLMERMRARNNRIIEANSRTEVYEPIFPLFIGEVFRNVLKTLNVKMVVCDFEADLEVANIAKELNAPVLSLDSDFYIFDVKYIPFTLDRVTKVKNLQIRVDRKSQGTEQERLLTCKIFNRDNFLRRTGLSKEMLAVLTVFLGNDFIERVKDIPKLFRHLNIRSRSRDFVGNIIGWLKNQNSKKALEALLSFYAKDEQKNLSAKIDQTIKGYTCGESKYLKYFEENVNKQTKNEDSDEYLNLFPKEFLDRFRRGLYQHNFIEILLNHRYYPKPLVENIKKEHSYKKSFEIISALHKILTNSSEKFVVFSRVGADICEEIVPPYKKELPSFESIQEMEVEARKNLLLAIVKIDRDFVENCLDLFDDSWKILLITLKFLSSVSDVTWNFIYSLVLCKIIITYVDFKLGQIRSKEELYYQFPKPRKSFYGNIREKKKVQNLSDSTKDITIEHSINALDSVMPFFQMKNEQKYNNKLFDRNLLHLMSEFQASLLHINFLNTLLNTPFENCRVWHCYNGTFIYNLANDLNSWNLDFVSFLLRQSPSIVNCFDFVIHNIKHNIEGIKEFSTL